MKAQPSNHGNLQTRQAEYYIRRRKTMAVGYGRHCGLIL